MTLDELVAKIPNTDYYFPLFTDAFGDNDVPTLRIANALVLFVRFMVSYESRFDEGLNAVIVMQKPLLVVKGQGIVVF